MLLQAGRLAESGRQSQSVRPPEPAAKTTRSPDFCDLIRRARMKHPLSGRVALDENLRNAQRQPLAEESRR
jgi:hypothetical protein